MAEALKAAEALTAEYSAKVGDITAVRAWLYFDQADTVTGVARHLRTHCVDGWHQFLGEQIGGMLAWPPESIEEVIRGVNFVANTGELLADGLVKATNAVEARFGRDRAIENYEFSTWQRAECKKKREELKDLFGEDWRYLRDVVDRELESTYCVKRMRERPEPPREFCWGFLKDALEDVDAELAGIDQALWRGHNFIEQARRDAADAVDAGFVRYLVAAFRAQLAAASASWARAERDSYCESYDNFESYRRLVLERPSRDADGVPLLSRSEIDRVVPAVFGVDVVWAALPTEGPRRERQARAILVAEVLYEARRKQLVAHAAAAAAEPVAKRRRTE